MKCRSGADTDSGLVNTVRGTAGHVADVTEGNSLLHDEATPLCQTRPCSEILMC